MFLFFHFLRSNVSEIKYHKHKWRMLFFTCIKLVACVLTHTHIKWRRLKFSFSKIAGSKLSTLLKMNFFIDIFQEFRLQILEHLFPRTLLSGCFCCLLVLLTSRFFKCFSQSKSFMVFWKPQRLTKWKFLKLVFWYSKANSLFY